MIAVIAPTEKLFQEHPYAQNCEAQILSCDGNALRLNRTIFYPAGGGQPGDTGTLSLQEGAVLHVCDTRKGCGADDIVHILDSDVVLPAAGTALFAELDWERRYRHMRMHTALHLLSAVVDAPVTGGQLTADKGRLDFDLEGRLDKLEVEDAVNTLVTLDVNITPRWITDAELDLKPDLVRTMRVKPPMGQGRIRLIDVEGIDLQPCGGTHVERTGEVGAVTVLKIQSKGKHNRRVSIAFKDLE